MISASAPTLVLQRFRCVRSVQRARAEQNTSMSLPIFHEDRLRCVRLTHEFKASASRMSRSRGNIKPRSSVARLCKHSV
eukprot:2380513-Rhodomonas_salina.2